MYHEKEVTATVSDAERAAMKGEVQLNVVSEPNEHFTTFDDSYLHKLLDEQKKGSGATTVLPKDGMKKVATEVMKHWYNLGEGDMQDFMQRNFDAKWKVLDTSNKQEIDYDEGTKFIRDFIGGIIQL